MGSGDPSGLQNRRELASLALVSSTLTRFRQFDSHTLPPILQHLSCRDPSTRAARSGFRLAARTPRKRLKFDSHTLPPNYFVAIDKLSSPVQNVSLLMN